MRDIQPIARDTALSVREHIQLCVRCGKCLSVCPTYSVLPMEPFSPRGRVALVNAADRGSVGLQALFGSVATCLLCGRCESVCDLDIPTVPAVAGMRRRISAMRTHSALESGMRLVFGSDSVRKRAARLAAGLKRFLPSGYAGGLTFRLLRQDTRVAALLDELKRDAFADLFAREEGAKSALFIGCAINHIFHGIGTSALDLLDAVGIQVDVPRAQTCCGLVLWAMGDWEGAGELARRNLDAFDGYETIVFLCRSCSYAFRHLYPELLGSDGRHLAERTRDAMDILASRSDGIGISDDEDRGVEFHIPCHAELTAGERSLLERLGATVEDKGCCGSGGSFGFEHPHLSRAIAERRLQRVERPRVVTDCMGCYIQLKYLRSDMSVEVESFCEWLKERTKTS